MGQADTLLATVLDTDRALRNARNDFLAVEDHAALTKAIGVEVTRAMADMNDDEAAAGLIRISDLLADIADSECARLLVTILGHDEPAVRVAAGEALVELLYERFAEVARVIDAEIERGASPTALAEIPFLLAEIGEPGGVKIATRLLKHPAPEVVAAAVEGLAAMGDPAAMKSLEPLRGDKRRVALEEEDEEAAGEVTIGELVGEAIDHLKRLRAS